MTRLGPAKTIRSRQSQSRRTTSCANSARQVHVFDIPAGCVMAITRQLIPVQHAKRSKVPAAAIPYVCGKWRLRA